MDVCTHTLYVRNSQALKLAKALYGSKTSLSSESHLTPSARKGTTARPRARPPNHLAAWRSRAHAPLVELLLTHRVSHPGPREEQAQRPSETRLAAGPTAFCRRNRVFETGSITCMTNLHACTGIYTVPVGELIALERQISE
jgi:hypothetical protein